MGTSGWYGVDFDGTLSEYNGYAHGRFGPPIEAMMKRVRAWLKDGFEVRIVTARAADPIEARKVQDWCEMNGLPRLTVTDRKDYSMIELWDDRAVTVIYNYGEPPESLKRPMSDLLNRVASILKGNPDPSVKHTWDDLPQRARRICEERDGYRNGQEQAQKLFEDAFADKLAILTEAKNLRWRLDQIIHAATFGSPTLEEESDAASAANNRAAFVAGYCAAQAAVVRASRTNGGVK